MLSFIIPDILFVEFGLAHGEGRCKYASGDVYYGHFTAGQRCGKGTYTVHETGDVFEGLWFDDKRNGPGNWTRSGGESISVTYKDDCVLVPQNNQLN